MNDEIKILDIKHYPEVFKVILEVPGEQYGQDYPKRIKHSFPNNPSFFREDREGNPLWLRKLHARYLKDPEEEPPVAEMQKKVSEVAEKYIGKKYGRKDKIKIRKKPKGGHGE